MDQSGFIDRLIVYLTCGDRVRTQILRIPDYAVIYYVLFCGFVAVDEARSRLRYLSRQVGIFKAAIASSWRLTKKE